MSLVVRVVHGSLTDGDETVLVNASNTNVALGSGVSAAISAACGPDYQARILEALDQTYGRAMAPGEVLVTDAGTHPRARWVAHVAVMDYREGEERHARPTPERIRVACERLWDAVEAVGQPSSVAMVALGAGVGGLGVREPTRLACETLAAHLAASPASVLERVTFYGWALEEVLAIADVVTSAFPDASLPDDVRTALATLRAR